MTLDTSRSERIITSVSSQPRPARSREQLGLFGRTEPDFDAAFRACRRRALEPDAWVDYVPAWVEGHGVLFDHLVDSIAWRTSEERMYDRLIPVPRLFAALPADGPVHPLIERIRLALSGRYGQDFTRISLAMYRDGQDSVAWHGDRVARTLPHALVATVSLGSPRRFLLRPYGGGSSLAYELGWGDLIVMGGSCQRTWQHSIPKLRRAHPRIALMLRPSWE
jgi:alkylated DNA repair dioxygenase AlkB